MVAGTHLSVMLHMHCLPCFNDKLEIYRWVHNEKEQKRRKSTSHGTQTYDFKLSDPCIIVGLYK